MINEKELQDNYSYAYTVSMLRRIVSRIRVADYRCAKELLDSAREEIDRLLRQCVKENYSEAEDLAALLASVAETEDMVLIGDLLEREAIPVMECWACNRCRIDEQIDDRYRLETTANGFLTIKDITMDVYLHSKMDPMDEARKLLERQYDCGYKDYAVWGCGLGYHIYQLYCISEGVASITVYETNPDMVQYARMYGVLSWIPQEILRIVYVKDAKEFFSNRQEQGVLYLKNYIVANKDKEQRNTLFQRYHRFIFGFDALHYRKLNFYRNRSLGLPYVSEIDHRQLNKEMVVIGGGPSLDHFMDTIRSWQGQKTLIAAGTIWKQLLRAGIRPDFVVIEDPYDVVFQQIEGIEDTTATLLIVPQTYWRVGSSYQGKKYLAPSPIMIGGLDDYMEKEGLAPWFSGGSVTVFELEFAVRMFADRVYLLGVDLSFPGGKSHAKDSGYCEEKDTTGLIPQEDVNGNTVYTDSVLIESKEWFEAVMAETEGIEYVNMSDVGVKLKGTVPYKGKPDIR